MHQTLSQAVLPFINGEIDRYEEIVAGLPQKIITYGFDSKYDFYPENINL